MHSDFKFANINLPEFYQKLEPITDWTSIPPKTKIFKKTSTQPLWYDTFIETCEHYGKHGVRYINIENKLYQSDSNGWYLWDMKVALDSLRHSLDVKGRCILSISILEQNEEAIDYLLESNQNINVADKNQRIPLHFAIEN